MAMMYSFLLRLITGLLKSGFSIGSTETLSGVLATDILCPVLGTPVFHYITFFKRVSSVDSPGFENMPRLMFRRGGTVPAFPEDIEKIRSE